MAYASWSVVFGEQPSAAKWNILGTNDAAFNNGTGLPSAGATTAFVATGQTTTSTTYTDLATVGPAVTITVGSTGLVLVGIHAQSSNSGANLNYTSFTISGATTLAAADKYSIGTPGTSTGQESGVWILSSQAAGSTTYTAKYRVNSGTGTFTNRHIFAIPL